jgi:hypothetical protein
MLHSTNTGIYGNKPMVKSIPALKKMFGMKDFVYEILKNFIFSRAAWEDNLNIVQVHNLEADLGVHTYYLGMNKFADLVKF